MQGAGTSNPRPEAVGLEANEVSSLCIIPFMEQTGCTQVGIMETEHSRRAQEVAWKRLSTCVHVL